MREKPKGLQEAVMGASEEGCEGQSADLSTGLDVSMNSTDRHQVWSTGKHNALTPRD